MKADWQRIFKPRYWIQNEPTNWEWDEILNQLLDKYDPIQSTSGCTVQLGPLEVWVSNYPYAYGSAYSPYKVRLLPSVRTRKRLRSILAAKRTPPTDSHVLYLVQKIRKLVQENA